MEIFLDKLDPGVWREPRGSGVKPKGAGFLAAKAKQTEDRNLKEVLEGLKITNPVNLTEKGKEETTQESDEDESFDADYEKLLAPSEALAKPRLPRPPVKKPRSRHDSTSPCIEKGDGFLDPFCERMTIAAGDSEVLYVFRSIYLRVL